MNRQNSNGNEEERLAWLQLARTPKVEHKQLYQLLKFYGTPSNVVKYCNSHNNRSSPQLQIIPRHVIEAELRAAEDYGAHIMMGYDCDFPQMLQAIDDPPLAITWRGNKQLLNQPTIAIVGARNASLSGMQLAANFAAEMSRQGLVIASGLARGIDTAAHKEAILQHRTVAVIAGGINNIYPKENQQLFAQISENGLLITEGIFGQAPHAQQFPRRNRLIAGLALGVVVIEAGLRSGSLLTANFALQQGRELCVVPGSPLDPRSQGCNMLIKRGAHLVENVDDIMAALPMLKFSAKPAPKEAKKQTTLFVGEIASAIKPLLSVQPVAIFEIAAHLNTPINLVNQAIVELEIAGYAERKIGNMVNKAIK